MLIRNDLLDENFSTFKAEAEQILHRYHYGSYYRTDLKESAVDMKEILALTRNVPMEFLKICSLYKFLSDFYSTSFVKYIVSFAQKHGYVFEEPVELKNKVGMDGFAVSYLQNVEKDRFFDMGQYCEIVFSKKKGSERVSVRVPVLSSVGGRLQVVDSASIMESLSELEG